MKQLKSAQCITNSTSEKSKKLFAPFSVFLLNFRGKLHKQIQTKMADIDDTKRDYYEELSFTRGI